MAAASLWKWWWIGSELALALADYGSPRVGCARHVDVPFEGEGNHSRLAMFNSIFGRATKDKRYALEGGRGIRGRGGGISRAGRGEQWVEERLVRLAGGGQLNEVEYSIPRGRSI